jgi:hypothetical protein
MGKYEWERGEIRIPKGKYPALRRNMIKAWNACELAGFEEAKRYVDAARKAAKGVVTPEMLAQAKAAGNFYQANWHLGIALEDTLRYRVRDRVRDRDDRNRIIQMLVHEGKVRAPRKKDLTLYPITKSCTISFDDWSVTFDNDTCTVTWDVDENNHACERAAGHPFVRTLFRALGAVRYTKSTGGTIYGNNEYARDTGYGGGGADYVVHTFGA